jgi:hypothetical protein
MQYLLLLYDPQQEVSAEELGRLIAEHKEFTRRIVDSGKYLASNALQPTTTATTVRVRDTRTITIDGPFAETREQLGGYYLVEADNLDEAIALAAKIPDARSGAVEIRPINVAIRSEFVAEGLIPEEDKR